MVRIKVLHINSIPMNKTRKKYVAIVKVGNNPDGTAKCVKYRFDRILKFLPFIDREFPDWRWMNVYSNKGENKRMQLASYTKKNRPVSDEI